jgi:xanthine dehydrogenase accessory factor
MIVTEDGATLFTIGGGALEAMVIEEAKSCLKEGRHTITSYALHDVGDDALGMACGGKATVYIEIVSPADRLVIFGAGHIGRALARMAPGLGFAVSVVDDRSHMLDGAAFPPGARFHHTDPKFRQNLPEFTSSSYIVLVTRCHETDEAALESLVNVPAAYIGMIGSKRKVNVVFDRLAERGIPRSALARVRAPIGFPIGSHVPEEVALSIMAEIVAVRNGVRELHGDREPPPRSRRGGPVEKAST